MDHEEIERQLRQAARMPQPFEWAFQQGQVWEKCYVEMQSRARWMVPLVLVKFLAMLAGVFLAVQATGWAAFVGMLIVVTLAALGVTSQVRRAQAYRNGWVDRGRHDIVEHQLVCSDPVADEAFASRMFVLNSEVLL